MLHCTKTTALNIQKENVLLFSNHFYFDCRILKVKPFYLRLSLSIYRRLVLFQCYIYLLARHKAVVYVPLLLLLTTGSLYLIRKQCANTVSISNDIAKSFTKYNVSLTPVIRNVHHTKRFSSRSLIFYYMTLILKLATY